MIAEDKAALRAQMRATRLAFSGPEIVVPAPLQARLVRPGIMASYLPMAGEIDPAPIVAAARAHGWRVALPHVTVRAAPMRFLEWRPGDSLEPGPFGLRQPADDAPERAPEVILTPLVAFDAGLNRLGQGAGYYDRAFAAFPDALRIGVAWSGQQVAKVPVDAWDIALHAVLTDFNWIGPDRL